MAVSQQLQPLVISRATDVPSAVVMREIRHDLRLRILQILDEAPGYIANEVVLQRILLTLGHGGSSDLLRTEIAWLAEQGLVDVSNEQDFYVARLSQRGQEVGRGLARVPGVGLDKEVE